MFDKLQAIAKVMVIPTVALYLGGFVCMTGYLARFGIVSFDVVNARFLVAGLHVLLAELIAVWLAWKIYKSQLDGRAYTYAGSPQRLFLYSEILLAPFGGEFALNILYGAAALDKMGSPEALHWRPWVKWDVLGIILNFTGHPGFGLTLALYLAFYGLLLIVPIVAAIVFIRRRRAKPSLQVDAPAATKTEKAEDKALPDTLPARLAVAAMDVICLSLIIAAAIDSWWRIRFDVIDANSLSYLSGDPYFATSIILPWFYDTEFSILFFLIGLPKGYAQLNFANFGQWLDPSNFADAIWRFVAPVLGSMLLFGATIFPRIPLEMGGGMPRQVSISFKTPNREFADGRKYLLGESSQFIFVVQVDGNGSRAFQINKDAIEAIETWQENPPHPTGAVQKKQVPRTRGRQKV